MFAYCLNNPIIFTDNDGLYPVVFPVAFEQKEEEEDGIPFTASVGLSFGFSLFGFFGFSGQICVSTDAQGNSELQGSFNGGFMPDNVDPASAPNGYKSVQASFMGFVTLTNAPTVENLTGPGYQMGGTIPVLGLIVVGYDYNILEDTANKTAYHGGTYSFGMSTPGAHIAWGQTATIRQIDFNLFAFFEDVQKRRLEMGYV